MSDIIGSTLLSIMERAALMLFRDEGVSRNENIGMSGWKGEGHGNVGTSGRERGGV